MVRRARPRGEAPSELHPGRRRQEQPDLPRCPTGEVGSYVLRRPPTGHLLPTAHDMVREHRIISAMGPAGVPAPPALGLCTDESVNGAPFYVMGFVDGVIAHDEAGAADSFDLPARRRAGTSLVDTLAQIHSVDPDEVGLGDLGRKDGYIARQLRRWDGQLSGGQ